MKDLEQDWPFFVGLGLFAAFIWAVHSWLHQ